MRHLFIVNPVAGGRNDVDGLRRKIEALMGALGAEYEVYVSKRVMDAAEKVKREAVYGEDLRVYACGGDGTLSECVHGAAGFSNAAVTHYPCGTGNDFVRTFGDDAKLFSDMEKLVSGEALPMDVIDVNGRKCIDIASVGIDARIGTGVHKYSSLPLIGSKAAYIVSLLVNICKGINSKMHIEGEGGEIFDGLFALVCACNGRYYGGGFNPTRTALPNDGILEFFVVKAVSLLEVAGLIGKYANGDYEKVPHKITHLRGRRITVEADEEFVVNIDGESLCTKKVQMRLIPDGVNFILPRSSRFLAEHLAAVRRGREPQLV